MLRIFFPFLTIRVLLQSGFYLLVIVFFSCLLLSWMHAYAKFRSYDPLNFYIFVIVLLVVFSNYSCLLATDTCLRLLKLRPLDFIFYFAIGCRVYNHNNDSDIHFVLLENVLIYSCPEALIVIMIYIPYHQNFTRI